MNNFEIREARKDDAGSISTLLLQLGYETPPAKIELLVLNSDSENSEILVGLVEGAVVAVMSIIYFDYFPSAEKLCRITAIVVSTELRGSGIGKKLVECAKIRALTCNCDVLEVTTSLKREATQLFYESIGFDKTSYKFVQKLGASV